MATCEPEEPPPALPPPPFTGTPGIKYFKVGRREASYHEILFLSAPVRTVRACFHAYGSRLKSKFAIL
ncbi:hypothetical protein CN597_23645 [Bacillus pseudomycoides]|nr:hypothetical protein CN597_23645 [Bacillus pseudomycoides]